MTRCYLSWWDGGCDDLRYLCKVCIMLTISNKVNDYRTRIDDFVSALKKTHIWYLYFDRAGRPAVTTHLGIWNCPNTPECFVAKGTTKGWCYVYLQTTISHLVRHHNDKTGKVTIIRNPDEEYTGDHFDGSQIGLANHGDHMTLGIQPRYPKEIELRTHYTTYQEDPTDFSYIRNELPCNMVLNENQDGIDKNTQCLPIKKEIPQVFTIGQIYNGLPYALDITNAVSKIALGLKVGGGVEYRVYNGKRYRIHNGKRGGKYIKIKGNRKYIVPNTRLQKGGDALSYKNTRFSDDIIGFLAERFVDRVFSVSQTPINNAIILYDEMSELGNKTNKYIVFMYNLVEDRMRIFYVDCQLVLMAYYAWRNIETASVQEKEALTNLNNIATQTLNRIIEVNA